MAKGGAGNKGKAKAKVGRPRARSRTRAEKPILMEDPALEQKILDHQLKAMGLYAAHTLGDGNCLFRALSDQLYGNPSHHLALRHQCCEFLASQPDRFRLFVDEDSVPGGFEGHVASMRIQGTYGTHIELSAIANLFKRPVKVVQPGLIYVIKSDDDDLEEGDSENGEVPIVADDEDDAGSGRERRQKSVDVKGKAKMKPGSEDQSEEKSPLYIVYHAWEHYSSLRNINGPHVGLPQVREIPLPPPSLLPPTATAIITPPSPSRSSSSLPLPLPLSPRPASSPSDDEIPPNPNHLFPLNPSPPLPPPVPPPIPVKRGRGRPRKYPLPVPATAAPPHPLQQPISLLPTPPSSDVDPSSSQLSLVLPPPTSSSSNSPNPLPPATFQFSSHHQQLLRAATPSSLTSTSPSDEEAPHSSHHSSIRENSRTRQIRLGSPAGSSNATSTPVASASSGSRSEEEFEEDADDGEGVEMGRRKAARVKGGTRITLREKREIREAEKRRKAELRRSGKNVGGGTRRSTRANAGQRTVGASALGEGVRTLFI